MAPVLRPAVSSLRSPHYRSSGAFLQTLRERVDRHFEEAGCDPRSAPWAAGRTLAAALWVGLSLAALLAAVGTAWAPAAALCLGFAAAAYTMVVLHDAVHGSLFRSAAWNRRVGHSAGLLGLDANWWRVKHNRLHHAYTNIPGADNDIEKAPLLRLSPHQPHRPHHHLQHVYAWLCYPFLHAAMVLAGVRFTLTGKVGDRSCGRPRGAELAWSVATRSAGVLFFLVLPLVARPDATPWPFFGWLALASGTYGMVLSCVFQVEHCVETSAFPARDPLTGLVPADWAVCQVGGTANVATGSRWLTAYTGGLNHHIEHHLMHRVSHAHYPAIAPIVRQTCREFGLPYVAYPSYRAALAAHGRHLRNLGRAARSPASAPAPRSP